MCIQTKEKRELSNKVNNCSGSQATSAPPKNILFDDVDASSGRG
jgi:hypothetical protein